MRTYYDSKGFFKMHWDLIYDVEDPVAALLLEYIIETYPVMKGSVSINGYEYKRYSNSFINERLLLSDYLIRESLKILVDKGFIDVQIVHGTTKARYIRLLTEVVNNQVNDHINNHINDHINNHINDHIKNFDIKETKKLRTEETKREIDPTKKEMVAPLLEEVLKFIKDDLKCTWKTDEEIRDFYNSVVYRDWKKKDGQPILEWHAYFKWFAEKDKPKSNKSGDMATVPEGTKWGRELNV